MTRATSTETTEVTPENDPHHSRNFGLAVFYAVLLRTGWIFKTESVIMPAVLDVIGGSGMLRGCLPLLNRFGQSVPPLLASDRVKHSRLKKFALFVSILVMSGCFLTLSLIWTITGGEKSAWLPFVFLTVYGVFFTATGIHQLLLYTLMGKLIRVVRRGRLALVGTVIGSTVAVTCAWKLLGVWLAVEGDPDFAMIFGFTGVVFLLASIVVLFFKERKDVRPEQDGQPHRKPGQLVRDAVLTFRHDRNFRKLAFITAMFGMCLTLFPHYQRIGRDSTELNLAVLIPWVLAQNIGAALFSIPAGWLADRFGNRLVLRIGMLLLCIPPVLALVLSRWSGTGQDGFIVVFGVLGLTPIMMRMLNNYTLEISDRHDHPKYLSTLSLAMAIPPICLSPFFGWLIDRTGFAPVFLVVVACVLCGWLMTFRLEEPRHRAESQ